MKSIAFPVMFTNTTTKIVEGSDKVLLDLKLLLLSDRGSLFGDPYYGTILKKLIFDLNSPILKDIIVDAIHTAIILFMPLIRVHRKDITIVQDGYKINVNIKAMNMLDFLTNMYNISLMNFQEES